MVQLSRPRSQSSFVDFALLMTGVPIVLTVIMPMVTMFVVVMLLVALRLL